MKLKNVIKQKSKILISLLILFIVILIIVLIVYKKDDKMMDSSIFKQEYEKLNNEVSSYGKEFRNIKIDEDNPFVYQTDTDIVNRINNKETFIVYFGFSECPWCRSVVPTIIDVAKDYNVETIYYVNVKNIRDILELDDNGNIITKKQGTDDYMKLIKLLDNVLDDYILYDEENKEINTNEKRIFAPNIISVVDGVAKELETGISDKLTDSYMELTKDIKEDMYKKLECIMKCMEKDNNTCKVNTMC